MTDFSLEKGVIILDSRNKAGTQDYLEIGMTDGRVIILTASPSGKLNIGYKLENSNKNIR